MHLKHFIISFDEAKKVLNKKLLDVKEATMKVANEVKVASAWAKIAKTQRDAAEAHRNETKVEKDAVVAQKMIAEAKILNWRSLPPLK